MPRATYKRALAAEGISVLEPANQFYGDRHGSVRDPAGNVWWIATHTCRVGCACGAPPARRT